MSGVEAYAQADWVDPEVQLASGAHVQLGTSSLLPAVGGLATEAGRPSSEFPAADREIIKRLAEEVAEIASLPVQKQTINEWKRLNGLRHGKPLVLVYLTESPLHEFETNGELTPRSTNSFCRQIELELRMRLFQWQHARGDFVMEPVIYVPYASHDSGFGFTAQEDTVVTDPDSSIVGHRYHAQIRNEKDVEKIHSPTVVCDWEMTELNYQAARDLLGGVLTVEKRGMPGYQLSPIDELFVWMGIEEAFACLVERPELFHMAMERLTAGHLRRVEQMTAMNLFTASFGNYKTCSGGLAYTD